MVNLHTSDEELIPASQTTPHVTNIIHSVLREDMPFDDFFALGKDTKKYLQTLSGEDLRKAFASIADKNPRILSSLMNNFHFNFVGGIYRMPPYYKPEKAHLPRQVAYKEYGTSPYHSEKFKTSSLDQLFIDIDESVAKNHIDVALVESLLIKQKIDRSIKADDILKKIYPVFVDLLEQGYNRQDLGC